MDPAIVKSLKNNKQNILNKNFFIQNKFINEIYRFIIFYICLIFVATSFTSIRTIDKSFQYADISIKETDVSSLNKEKEKDLFQLYKETFILNLGKTMSGEDVSSHIISRLIPTLSLAFFSTILGGGSAIFFALLSAYINKNWVGAFFRILSSIILSTPVFVVAVFLFLVFFLYFPLLPPGGYEAGNPAYLVLPGISLGSRVFARIYFYSESEIKSEQDSPFVLLLKARGFSEFNILFKYIFYKVIPLLSIFILLDLSSLLTGAMIVEEVFFFPGIGKSMYTAIKSMDENLLKALLVYSGVIFYILTRSSRLFQSNLTGTES